MNDTIDTQVADLEAAGFSAAAARLRAVADRKRRLTLAYEHYRYVTSEKIEAFQAKLKAATLNATGREGSDLYHNYDTLVFVPIELWTGQKHSKGQGLPPADVITKVAEAKRHGVFDTLEVAYIDTVREYKDPIVFGRIDGCDDAFYIAEWGDDVSISDLIDDNDG
jgi:hypothetical protein